MNFTSGDKIRKPRPLADILADTGSQTPRGGTYLQTLLDGAINFIDVADRLEWEQAKVQILDRIQTAYNAIHCAGRMRECADLEELIALVRFCQSMEDIEIACVKTHLLEIRRRF